MDRRGAPLMAIVVISALACDAFHQTFTCSMDTECVRAGVHGRCELARYCSFPDSNCPGGMRYGELAGPEVAGQCVLRASPDGGATVDGSAGPPDASNPNDACVPTTCAALGLNCDSVADRCGGTLDCGTCSGSATCGGSGRPNVCGTCTPTTCTGRCSTINDGCGHLIVCDPCPMGQTCNSFTHTCL
jgi:hypothetical protein